MTDTEIIKALECCCKNNNCEGCPLDYLTFSSQCASELAVKSLDLINRQKAEIERLKKLLEEADVNYNKCAKRFYKEAIKEFAYRLKQKSEYYENGQGWEGRICYEDDIDKLLKEMVGDTE